MVPFPLDDHRHYLLSEPRHVAAASLIATRPQQWWVLSLGIEQHVGRVEPRQQVIRQHRTALHHQPPFVFRRVGLVREVDLSQHFANRPDRFAEKPQPWQLRLFDHNESFAGRFL